MVTNDLGKKIAAAYGIETLETLTGFKYIGEKKLGISKKQVNTLFFSVMKKVTAI